MDILVIFSYKKLMQDLKIPVILHFDFEFLSPTPPYIPLSHLTLSPIIQLIMMLSNPETLKRNLQLIGALLPIHWAIILDSASPAALSPSIVAITSLFL